MELHLFVNENKETLEIIVPFISSLIGAFIGGLGVFFTVFRKTKIAQKQLLVQTITEERIKWINALRDEFVSYNKNLTMYQTATNHKHNEYDKTEGKKRYELLLSSVEKITLMLNPSEHYMEYLISELHVLVQVLSTTDGDYDIDQYIKTKGKIKDLQQIILKSEWRRVKEESTKGKELSSKKVNDLYNKIAKSINIEVYNFVSEWIQMEEDSKKMSEEEFYEKHFG